MRARFRLLSWRPACNRSKWICGLLLAPMGLAARVPVPDSLVTPDGRVKFGDQHVTSFTFAGGKGTHFREVSIPFGYSDCGPYSIPVTSKNEFKEIGVGIDHEASKRFHLGVRGGYVWSDNTFAGGYDTTLTNLTDNQHYLHVDPYVAIEWKYFGLGLGGVFSGAKLPGGYEEYPLPDGDAQLSGHVRVGPLRYAYANMSIWEGVPLLTSGHITTGVGLRPLRPVELYGGFVSDGPYRGDNWLGRITVDANPNWSFYLNMRFRKDWENLGDEYGTSLGATYHIHH